MDDQFRAYQQFTVRVDRFFSLVSIFGLHYGALKSIHAALPDGDVRQRFTQDDTVPEVVRDFVQVAGLSLDYLATTNVFADEGSCCEGDVSTDLLNFAFYTCYCFQWTLFENVLKGMVRIAIDAGVLPAGIPRRLESVWRLTQQFLQLVHSGDVFGHSPFHTVLPVVSWVPATEVCGYDDLDQVRRLRNDFIHGIEAPEITGEDILLKQRRYERSMWILRQFAGNVYQDVGRLLRPGAPDAPSAEAE